MKIYTSAEVSDFLMLIPKIKENRHEWKIIEATIIDNTNNDIQKVAKRLRLYFVDTEKEGDILICNNKELIILAHTGLYEKIDKIEKDFKEYLPENSCKITAREMSSHEIEVIKVKFDNTERNTTLSVSSILQERMDRRENVIMIAEDDMFMRSLAKKALSSFATIVEVDNGDKVLELYQIRNPDIIFLDIHLPGSSGLDLLDKLLRYDRDAYIVMLSADSNRENIAYTIEHGAKGFVAKPFTSEKLIEKMRSSPTYTDRVIY